MITDWTWKTDDANMTLMIVDNAEGLFDDFELDDDVFDQTVPAERHLQPARAYLPTVCLLPRVRKRSCAERDIDINSVSGVA